MQATAKASPEYATAPEYVVALADNEIEVRRAQRLRYQVFNLELGEGLESSGAKGLDADAFDDICDHLMVTHTPTGELVGTYRMQAGNRALRGTGYYSEREFDLGAYEELRPQLVELGRACVHREHRRMAVIALLWKGIAEYALQRGARFLMGCSSLNSRNPAEGASVFARLCREHLVEPVWQTRPQPGWECPLEPDPLVTPEIPRLLGAYLSLGAKICGAPAWDREFGTIDFLTLLDLQRLTPEAKRRFLRPNLMRPVVCA